MRPVLRVLIAAGLAAAASLVAAEEVYRWVDENGVVHFSAMPPRNAEADIVDVGSTPAAAPVDAEPTPEGGDTGDSHAAADQPEMSIAQQRREERAERRFEAERARKEREINCTRMQDAVARLEPSPRVIITDEAGNPRRLDDEQRLEALAEAKAYVAANCQDR